MKEVLIVGGGLAGGLLALAMRERGVEVSLIAAQSLSATQQSYRGIPGWPQGTSVLALQAAKASALWTDLQARYGDLGWAKARLGLHSGKPWERWVPVPAAQVDTARFQARLPEVFRQAGVRLLATEGLRVERDLGQWLVPCRDGSVRRSDDLVLAAGAACRSLWPTWPEVLRGNWAGVLELPHCPTTRLQLPSQYKRPAVERRSGGLNEPCSIVDATLVPSSAGALLGQITLFTQGLAFPDSPLGMEQALRQAIAASPLAKDLDEGVGIQRQVAVALSTTGIPWAGPLPEAPDLFGFRGFSSGFAQVPLVAPLLADILATGSATARRQLEQLQVRRVVM